MIPQRVVVSTVSLHTRQNLASARVCPGQQAVGERTMDASYGRLPLLLAWPREQRDDTCIAHEHIYSKNCQESNPDFGKESSSGELWHDQYFRETVPRM